MDNLQIRPPHMDSALETFHDMPRNDWDVRLRRMAAIATRYGTPESMKQIRDFGAVVGVEVEQVDDGTDD